MIIQRALTGDIEAEEVALNKIGRKRKGKTSHLAIELSVLNMALVEVHQELASVHIGPKDMAYKCKRARKGAKEVVKQLLENTTTIQNLE